jgi:hypothetical protein
LFSLLSSINQFWTFLIKPWFKMLWFTITQTLLGRNFDVLSNIVPCPIDVPTGLYIFQSCKLISDCNLILFLNVPLI